MRYLFFFFHIFALLLVGCSGKVTRQILDIPFSDEGTPPPPDYSKAEYWAALPDKKDNADRVPKGDNQRDEQDSAKADVFFIHPTTYLKNTEHSSGWNADLHDYEVNDKTDGGTILYQASVFNGAGKIYAPRYRQAQLSAYFPKNKEDAKHAFDVAYGDVKNAFQYYLDHYNNGRPIIIASHSQGSTHSTRLMQDFFDSKTLMNQLVAAYIIGMPVYDSLFTVLKPCGNKNETGCYVTWRTYARDYFPPNYEKPTHEAVCTNPLTWTTDSTYAPEELNRGGILRNFNKIVLELSDAQVLDGVVRINKPHFTGNFLFNLKNYHVVDYNLFYLNIRENAQLRVKNFLEKGNAKHTSQ